MKQILLQIVNKLFKYSDLNKDIKTLKSQSGWQHKEHQCLQYLINLIGNNHFITNTRMTMSPVVICHILNEIIINKRKSIIEFGGGSSTLFIATLLNTYNLDAEFVCIESDKDWMQVIKNWVSAKKAELKVQFVHAPIKNQHFDTKLADSFLWYDKVILQNELMNKKFDLVIVDGPQGSICKYSRYPAIPFLQQHLLTNYSIFLDDYNRPDEKAIYKQWCTLLGEKPINNLNRYAYISPFASLISRP